jgi:hypothetical protein
VKVASLRRRFGWSTGVSPESRAQNAPFAR